MSDTQLVSRLPALRWRKAWLQIDQKQSSIEFAKTNRGVFVLHAAFITLMALSQHFSNARLGLIALTIIAIAIVPKKRVPIIVGASVFYIFVRPFRVEGWVNLLNAKVLTLTEDISTLMLQMMAVGAFFAFSFFYLKSMKWPATALISKRPVVSLSLIWAIFVLAALLVPDHSFIDAFLWTFSGVLISSLWVLAYAALDQKGRDPTPIGARNGFMRPFWGGSATPIGKSFGYLNKFDAKSSDELAVTRLKAIKLATWALILTGLMHVLEFIARDYYNLPQLQNTILAHASGKSFSASINWLSLIYNYFIDLVIISVWGHFIVATIRMVGYRIPRNTCNPLAARTIAEFWNRYFFYFKELLVDIFFYPAFVRYFKSIPKLRIVFATFCAAGFGNFFYHFSRDTFQFAYMPFLEALAIFQSAAVYSILLASGLVFSQLNPFKPKPKDGFFRYELVTRLNVISFFCFVKIFDDISGEGSVMERAAFTVDLFRF